MKEKIKLFDPSVDESELKATIDTLNSKTWASGSGVGNVKKFEEKFKKFLSCDECVAVNSGTAALHLALSLFDIKNHEVLVPSLTFVSTVHSIKYNFGNPVFVDVDPNTLCMDVDDIRKKITKKTRLILPVHFGGLSANLKEILKIASNFNLEVIDDAAHSSGSSINGKKIGSFSNNTCFSFHPVKNLAMPTGGLISLNGKNAKKNKEILNIRRWCGISNRQDSDYDVSELGWNFYMNELSASIGLTQLKKLKKLNNFRKYVAKKYFQSIHTIKKMPFDENCSYHFYWILVENRDEFRKNLFNLGIETGIHYKPVHQMSMYKDKQKLPITESIGTKIVTLPTHPNLSEANIELIIKSVNRYAK